MARRLLVWDVELDSDCRSDFIAQTSRQSALHSERALQPRVTAVVQLRFPPRPDRVHLIQRVQLPTVPTCLQTTAQRFRLAPHRAQPFPNSAPAPNSKRFVERRLLAARQKARPSPAKLSAQFPY